MNFKDALETINLILESGEVPLLIGESGIGKTALIKKLCKDKGYYNITIDGNMLKEGEIGGLPTIEEYKTFIDGREILKKRTVYATHTKLQEIDDVIKKDKDKIILLFIDEINRCEHTVQQELMNIILNREINGYKLPYNVKVVAAMNPSNKYDEYRESNYQVVDMDPAQEDRFVWVELECDVKSWLSWGMENNYIHEDILNFISSFPEYLHTPYSDETIKATPRSWERISKAYKVFLNKKNEIPFKIFQNVVKGNVGPYIAEEFHTFLENNKNPIIRPEDIFLKDEIDKEIINKIKSESHSRLYMAAKNALNYINNKEKIENEIKLFSQFLDYFPSDLKFGIMKEIKESCPEHIYNKFLMEDYFIDGFFKMYNEIEE